MEFDETPFQKGKFYYFFKIVQKLEMFFVENE